MIDNELDKREIVFEEESNSQTFGRTNKQFNHQRDNSDMPTGRKNGADNRDSK